MLRESEFGNKKQIPQDLLNKPEQEIVDGLMNMFDNDEELALKSLNAHLEANDGYIDREKLNNVKEKLKDMIESKKSHFRKLVEKLLGEDSVVQKPERAAGDSYYMGRQDAAKDDEIKTYMKYGINPNFDYDKTMLRYIDKKGDKQVIVLDGIDKDTGKDPDEQAVFYRTVSIEETNNGKYVYRYSKQLYAMSVTDFLKILHNDLNNDVKASTLKKVGEDPKKWQQDYSDAWARMRAAFLDWYRSNVTIYPELETYDRITQQKIYQKNAKDGYTVPEAIKIVDKDLKKKRESAELTEAQKDKYEMDAGILQQILPSLGINPKFISMPLTVEYPDMGDDTEPPSRFTIQGVSKEGTEGPDAILCKDWDKARTKYTKSVKEVLDIQERPENANPSFDIWDMASTANKQHRALNKGTAQGRWVELTKDQTIAALEYAEKQNPEKYPKMVDKYLAPQSFESRNPLVLDALKSVNSDAQVRPMKNSTALHGFAYYLFRSDEGRRAPAHGRYNPYQLVLNRGRA